MDIDAFNYSKMRTLRKRVLEEVSCRGLKSGDRFLNTADVAKILGVRLSGANKVMQSLTKENLLIRRQGAGTFVGPQFESHSELGTSERVSTIFIVFPHHYFGYLYKRPVEDLLKSVQGTFQSCVTSFVKLPKDNEVGYLDGILKKADFIKGVIAVSCDQKIHHYLASQKLPAISCGSTREYFLPFIDTDKKQSGQILARHLLENGHKKFVLLNNDSWRVGDEMFMDGLIEVFEEARLSIGNLKICNVFPSIDCLKHLLDELFNNGSDTTAIFYRVAVSPFDFYNLLEEKNKNSEKKMTMVANIEIELEKRISFAYTSPVQTDLDFSQEVSRFLENVIENKSSANKTKLFPVKLHLPDINAFNQPENTKSVSV